MSEPISTIEQLVAARQARGVSAEDMLRVLKIAPRQLEALERGDWSALPGTPFVRGVLRAYARALEVDVAPLLDTVGGRVQPNELKPAGPLDEPLRSRGMLGFGSGGSGHRLVWVGLVLLGVLAFALFFGRGTDFDAIPSWFDKRTAATDEATAARPEAGATPGSTVETIALPGTASTAGQSAEPAAGATGASSGSAAATSAATSVPPAGAGAGANPAPPAAAPGAAPGADGAAASASGAAGAAGAPAGQGAGGLRLSFAGESWVDIKQADVKVLLSGLQRASTAQTLNPTGSVTLVIGNASGVTVEFAGKPVDLKPHIRGSIARLTLP